MYPTQRLTPELLESHRATFHDWRKTWRIGDEELEEEHDIWVTRIVRTHTRIIERAGPKMPNITALRTMSSNWRFTVTNTGFYCLAPLETEEGDEVVILDGGKVPMVIRPVKDRSEDGESCYEVIGAAYVHGFMDGQAARWVERGELQEGSFTLV
jgi:hypothetical protein